MEVPVLKAPPIDLLKQVTVLPVENTIGNHLLTLSSGLKACNGQLRAIEVWVLEVSK